MSLKRIDDTLAALRPRAGSRRPAKAAQVELTLYLSKSGEHVIQRNGIPMTPMSCDEDEAARRVNELARRIRDLGKTVAITTWRD